jgi:hypothetical protein
MELIGITVGVVNSRGGDFINDCRYSIERQWYDKDMFEYIEIDNLDRKKTIGKCYNEIAQKSTKDWILFVGDDDMISRMYLLNLSAFYNAYMEKKHGSPVAITTNLALYSTEKMLTIDAVPQGMWNREFLLENPFNELLPRYVDAELFERTEKLGEIIVHDITNSGYYYRQHDDNVSGNKFERKGGIEKVIAERIKRNKEFGVII